MTIPLLSSLREPPVVGRFYMVPTVRYRLGGELRRWPVIGPVHEDRRDLDFPNFHFHLDLRFLSGAAVTILRRRYDYSDETLVAGVVLTEPTNILTDEWVLRVYGRIPRRPTLRRMKCNRASYGFSEFAREKIAMRVGGDKLAERFGAIAEPIRLRDGRLLCPHRKADLSQFPADENGIVTCPLHGLRVRCQALPA